MKKKDSNRNKQNASCIYYNIPYQVISEIYFQMISSKEKKL